LVSSSDPGSLPEPPDEEAEKEKDKEPETPGPGSTETTSGLLAAKRRARKKLDRDKNR